MNPGDNLIENPLDHPRDRGDAETAKDRPKTVPAPEADPGDNLITNPLDKPGAGDNLIQNPLDKSP